MTDERKSILKIVLITVGVTTLVAHLGPFVGLPGEIVVVAVLAIGGYGIFHIWKK